MILFPFISWINKKSVARRNAILEVERESNYARNLQLIRDVLSGLGLLAVYLHEHPDSELGNSQVRVVFVCHISERRCVNIEINIYDLYRNNLETEWITQRIQAAKSINEDRVLKDAKGYPILS
jgi:hypothetical protein